MINIRSAFDSIETRPDTIIALERAALERWGQGDPSGFLDLAADDVCYFDPFLERRLDGIDALRSYYESIRGEVKLDRFDLINPRIQPCGDIAVLTFNFDSWDRDGRETRWNCTEVFRLTGSSWKIIQTHWSFAGAAGP